MLLFISTFLLWATFHSISASMAFKSIIRGAVGQRVYNGFYRLSYNTVSVITILPLLVVGLAGAPNDVLYKPQWPSIVIFLAFMLIAVVGLLISMLHTDLVQFAGIGQAVRFLQGAEDSNLQTSLIVEGPYRYVRHPLYLFTIILFWSFPFVTWTTVTFNILATVYFIVGSIFEDRRLLNAYGETYQQYRQEVPRLFPIKLNR